MIDPSDTAKIVSMQTRGEKSMDRYNSRNNTTFATLEEYYNTPKGRELLEGIRESVITGNPVKYKKSKSVVTTLEVENQPTLFSTTTSPATSASLTLEGLQTLHAEIQKVSEKSSKFVEGPTVTEESILDQLRDITECFS
jgi:hypothetical protein